MAKEPNVAKLVAEMMKQEAKLKAYGKTPPKKKPTLINRIFDVLQRPNYAMAGALTHPIKSVAEPKKGLLMQEGGLKNALLPVAGAARGLAGKDKYTFSEFFKEQAKSGPEALKPVFKNRVFQGVGGFGADVAFDPTTYMGIGLLKAVPAAEKAAVAGKAIKGARTFKGGSLKTADYVGEATKAVKAAEQPGKLGFKIGGRNAPVIGSERLYGALAKGTKPVRDTALADALNRTFRTSATFPGKIKAMAFVPRQAGVAEANRLNKEVLNTYGKLSGREAGDFSRMIQQGHDFTGQVSKNGIDLGQLQQDFNRSMREMDNAELLAGYSARAGHNTDNFVPYFYPNPGTRLSRSAKRMHERVYQATVNGEGTMPTFDEMKAAGLHPIENIVDVWRLRQHHHQGLMAYSDFKNKGLDEMGQVFSGKNAAEAQRAAEMMGLERVPNELLGGSRYKGKDVYAPRQLVDAMEELGKMYNSSEATHQLARIFDGVNRLWKTGVTTINPGHHMRNIIGDVFNNWLDGVRTPGAYSRGTRVALDKGGDIKVGDLRKTTGELMSAYTEHGGMSGFRNVELIGTDPARMFGGATRGVNRVLEGAREITGKREDIMRLSHYVDAIRDYGKRKGIKTEADFIKASKEAIERVKKYNFDYTDLTRAETQIRRLIPFYTFMRKNMPLQLETMFTQPGMISRLPKGFAALETLLGTDREHLPMTEVMPDWLKEIASVRLQGEGQSNLIGKLLGGTENAVYGEVPVPFAEIGRQFGGITEKPQETLRRSLGQMGLASKVIELATQRSLLTGQPTGGMKEYAANQLPWTRSISQLISPRRPERVIMPGERFAGRQQELLNILGLGLREITGQTQLSQLRKEQDPMDAMLREIRRKQINRALRTG